MTPRAVTGETKARARHAVPVQSKIENRQSKMPGTYPGGKNAAGTWQWLIDLMPTHARYAEPFAGSAALARRKTPALETVLIDSSARVSLGLHAQWAPLLTTVRHADGLLWLMEEARAWDRDALVYCDPPYMHEARVKTRLYEQEWGTAQHELLLHAVGELDCLVMLSGYRTALYDRALSSWHRAERYVVTRGGTTRQECCWCNFDPEDQSLKTPLRLIAGRDYRERERIGRKAKRWARMLTEMPPTERAAVLTATLAAYAEGRNP
jgi:hypothetical protein